MASLFEQEIQTLTGVGEKRAKLFHKLGVFSVGALLRFYPRTYEDWSQPLTIEQAPFGVPCAIRAVVLHKPIETRIRKGKTSVTDGMRDLQLTFFNNPYIVNTLTEGKEYIFYGKVSGTLLRKEMSVPEFYPVSSAPSVCPIYHQTEGLSTRMIRNAVKHALALLPEQVKDPIPYSIRMQHHLCELRYALEQIHFPDSMESKEIAKKRLVFEELFTLLENTLREGKTRIEMLIPYAQAGKIQLVRKYGELLKEEYREDGIYIEAYVPGGMSLELM